MIIIFLLCAFRSGTDRYYLKKVRGEKVRGKEILFYFKPRNSLRLIAFYLNFWLRKLILLLLCFAPFVLVSVYLVFYLENSDASAKVSLIVFFSAIVFAVNGIYFFIRLNSFLFLSRYYFASDKYVSFRQLFNYSYLHLEGKRRMLLRKRIGFIGWFASCVFVFPVAFVRSYYMEALADFASDLIED